MRNFVKIGPSIEKILQFFSFLKWLLLRCWNFEFVRFYYLAEFTGLRHITMPNLVKIGKFVAKILQFFEFSRWRPPPY